MPLEIQIESSGMIRCPLIVFRLPRHLPVFVLSSNPASCGWVKTAPITMSAKAPPLDDQIRFNWCVSRARAALIACQPYQKDGSMSDGYWEKWLSWMQTELVLSGELTTSVFLIFFLQEHASYLIGQPSVQRNHLYISPFLKLLSQAVYGWHWDDILELDGISIPLDCTRPIEHHWNAWWQAELADTNATVVDDIQRFQNQVRNSLLSTTIS